MKVTLINATSIDGFIATSDDNTDWVDDEDILFAEAPKVGAIIFGRRTYDPGGEEFKVPDCMNFIITSEPDKYQPQQNVTFLSGSPQEVLQQIEQAGFTHVLLGGGGQVNAAFAKAGLINEMILDVHPVALGRGVKLLGDLGQITSLELIEATTHKSFVQLRYKVLAQPLV